MSITGTINPKTSTVVFVKKIFLSKSPVFLFPTNLVRTFFLRWISQVLPQMTYLGQVWCNTVSFFLKFYVGFAEATYFHETLFFPLWRIRKFHYKTWKVLLLCKVFIRASQAISVEFDGAPRLQIRMKVCQFLTYPLRPIKKSNTFLGFIEDTINIFLK